MMSLGEEFTAYTGGTDALKHTTYRLGFRQCWYAGDGRGQKLCYGGENVLLVLGAQTHSSTPPTGSGAVSVGTQGMRGAKNDVIGGECTACTGGTGTLKHTTPAHHLLSWVLSM
jgi:hypothetical protein